MPSRKFFALFTPQKFHSQQISLAKMRSGTQTVTRSGDEATCEIWLDLDTSDWGGDWVPGASFLPHCKLCATVPGAFSTAPDSD